MSRKQPLNLSALVAAFLYDANRRKVARITDTDPDEIVDQALILVHDGDRVSSKNTPSPPLGVLPFTLRFPCTLLRCNG